MTGNLARDMAIGALMLVRRMRRHSKPTKINLGFIRPLRVRCRGVAITGSLAPLAGAGPQAAGVFGR